MFPRSNPWFRATATVLSLLLLLQTMGCYSWQSGPTPGPSAPALTRDTPFLVTTTAQIKVKMRGLHVRNDSLIGWPLETWRTELAYPLRQIASIQRSEFDPGKTTLLVVALGAVVGAIAAFGHSLGGIGGFGGIGDFGGLGGLSQRIPASGVSGGRP